MTDELKKIETDIAAAEGGEVGVAEKNGEKPEADKKDGKTKIKRKPQAKRKKGAKTITNGNVYILATFNNTIVTFADKQGNVLGWCSAGQVGFKGPKKSTPYAAGIIVKTALGKIADVGLRDVDVFLKGIGQGREGAIRALNANGLNVLSVIDMTPLPHNGCRQKRPRRV
ncbi:MAG: 30S ribosomal protein S11 [Candidatus Magasanikbacteria bacterium]|nr:30S ribosomal protein S11 [Candidatus Magasanikbacteria bacterium]